jgi:hypothetical protein
MELVNDRGCYNLNPTPILHLTVKASQWRQVLVGLVLTAGGMYLLAGESVEAALTTYPYLPPETPIYSGCRADSTKCPSTPGYLGT